jgi:AraC-like DNA-binding protein
VRCFWILEDLGASAGRPAERILPDGCPEIVVHYGQPMRAAMGSSDLRTQPRAVAAGQLCRALHLAPDGPIGTIGARLQPWAAGALLRERLDRLTDRTVPLDALWGREAGELEERIGAASGDQDRAAILGAAVARRLDGAARRTDGEAAALAAALGWIEASRGALSVTTLAARLQWSPRRLERHFLAGVGLPPKTMGRIARFQHVVRAVQSRAVAVAGAEAPPSLAALAAHAGYADQAHLAREFREFAGGSVTAWLAEQHALSDCFSGRPPSEI